MPNSRWPEGALRTFPIKRKPTKVTPLDFAKTSLSVGAVRPDAVLGDLKAWFEAEWDGGGIVLETWDEVCVVVMALFGGKDE